MIHFLVHIAYHYCLYTITDYVSVAFGSLCRSHWDTSDSALTGTGTQGTVDKRIRIEETEDIT